MTTSDDRKVDEELATQPEDGATPEAVALHGSQAREERFAQPDTVALPADTLVADPQGYDPNADTEDDDI